MAITITLNNTFQHLNGVPNLGKKQNAQSIEKEAIVDIAIGSASGDKYVTNGITLDFSKIRRLGAVYILDVLHNGYVLPVKFVPAALNASSSGKLMFFDNTGVELVNNSTAIQNVTIRALIRGR